MNGTNKLECFYLESISRIVLCLRVRLDPTKVCINPPQGKAPGLTHKYETRLETLAKDKHSGAFGLCISEEESVI